MQQAYMQQLAYQQQNPWWGNYDPDAYAQYAEFLQAAAAAGQYVPAAAPQKQPPVPLQPNGARPSARGRNRRADR